MDIKASAKNKIKKIFGIGPAGAAASLLLLAFFVWADSMAKLTISVSFAGLMKIIGILLIIFGCGLHFWSLFTLRSWWVDDKLCTKGPFKHFRHPMYAAWITFISSGITLYFNSWFYLLWLFLLHLLWHNLVKKEEILMMRTFGDKYNDYAGCTGRFFPKIIKKNND